MRKYTSRYLLSFELTRICIDLYARILNLQKFKWSNINDPETTKMECIGQKWSKIFTSILVIYFHFWAKNLSVS